MLGSAVFENRTSVLFRRVPKRECGLMKRKDKLAESKQVDNSLLKLASSRAKFVLLLMALTFLCTSAMAQENTTDYWLKKGYELSANGSNEQALQAYEKVISIDPENSVAWINKAYTLSSLNRTSESNKAYYKALEITNKTLEADPRNATLWLGKGILLNNVSNVQEAVKAFDNANKIDPKNEMAWMMKGVLLARDLQRYDDAVKVFDSAFQINPKNAQVWSLKGNALKALGRQAEADAAYAKAKELGYRVPNLAQENTTQLMKKGYELSENGSYEQAIQAFDIAIRLMPANDTRSLAIAWEGKALALHYMGNNFSDMARDRYEMALQSYDRAIALDPSFTGREAQLNKAGVLSEMGKYKNSSEILDKVIQTIPANDTIYASVVWIDKGSVLEKMGKYDEALNAFNKALGMNPSNMAAMQGKGSALKSLGRNSETEGAFAKAKELGYRD